jgi:hypothetical protein
MESHLIQVSMYTYPGLYALPGKFKYHYDSGDQDFVTLSINCWHIRDFDYLFWKTCFNMLSWASVFPWSNDCCLHPHSWFVVWRYHKFVVWRCLAKYLRASMTAATLHLTTVPVSPHTERDPPHRLSRTRLGLEEERTPNWAHRPLGSELARYLRASVATATLHLDTVPVSPHTQRGPEIIGLSRFSVILDSHV